MITLVTGSPGAGKTLWTVKQIVDHLIPSGRRIYTNIAGFTHPAENVTVCDDRMPFEWQSVEDGAIFIFDEVQRQYPPRHSTSKVPEYISGYQTHRHRGFDFYFITQGPKLLDRHLWDLTERHVHLFRAFGLKRSKILEWASVNETPQPPQTHSTAVKQGFAFPKKYFQFYKSASIHTDTVKLPWHLILFGLLSLIVALGLGFYAVKILRSQSEDFSSSLGADGSDDGIDDCDGRIIGAVSGRLIYASGRTRSLVDLQKNDPAQNNYLRDSNGVICKLQLNDNRSITYG